MGDAFGADDPAGARSGPFSTELSWPPGPPRAPDQPTRPKVPLSKRRFGLFTVALALLVGFGFGVAAGAGLTGDEDPTAFLASAEHDLIDDPELMPNAGDCLRGDPFEAEVVTQPEVVDCRAKHGSEVIAVVTLGDGDMSDHGVLDGEITAACDPEFERYVGTAYYDSALEYWGVPPTVDAWDAGDRTLFCLLDSELYRDGKGSARGAER